MINKAIEAAILAGKEILDIYNDPNSDFSIERKADDSPLTIADKASHNAIVDVLAETNIPILSEEGMQIDYEERKKWSTFWLIDPLDGTKEFIKKNGEFTVNIALMADNHPIMGVIYVPISGELYVGNCKTGAWKAITTSVDFSMEALMNEGEKLPQSNDNNEYRVVGSRSHMSEETETYIDRLNKMHSKIEVVSKGSSLKICLVAEGLADEYPRFGPTMEWDTAAGHAIANAAGKKVWQTDAGSELIYNKKNLLNPHFIVK